MMRPAYLERSDVGRVFDVPAHLYRAAASDALGWLWATLRRNDDEAWARELRLRFFSAFFHTQPSTVPAAPASKSVGCNGATSGAA